MRSFAVIGRSVRRFRSARGFSLTELLVALAILALLAAAAVPLFNRELQQSRRVDATGALLRIAVAQERFFFENGRYAGAAELAAPSPGGLGIAATERGYYTLELHAPGGDPDSGYRARAVALPGGVQGGDEECRAFSLDSSGRRDAETAGGQDSSQACWP